MSRRNRYRIFSSDIPDYDENLLPSDNALPASDPPGNDSGSDSGSDSDPTTPIQLPALTSLIAPALIAPASSSPSAGRADHPRRIYRVQRRSSAPTSPERPAAPIETSDDIILTPRAEKKFLRDRRELHRQDTRMANRLERIMAIEQDRIEAEQLARSEEEKRLILRNQLFSSFLHDLKQNDFSLADFVDHAFDPATPLDYDWHWRGFFAQKPLVERIFGYWTTSKYNKTTRVFIHNWATEQVTKRVYSEAREITKTGILSKAKKVVNEHFFLHFSLEGLTTILRSMAPTAFAVFEAFSTTTRQLSKSSVRGLQKKAMVQGAAALNLLRAFSQRNNYSQAVTATYLAATGAQRQHFSVLAFFGAAVGYSTVTASASPASKTETSPTGIDVDGSASDSSSSSKRTRAKRKSKPGKNKKKNAKKRKRAHTAGLLSSLREACMLTVRTIALLKLFALVYDNINLMIRIAEQILGRKNAQENGTCATMIPLHNAELEHMLSATLDNSILNAKPLTIDDIVLNDSEFSAFRDNMIHTVMRTIVLHGGEGYQKWKAQVDATQPVSEEAIKVHKTALYPLPTMEIDENSITGNVEVMEAIYQSLGIDVEDPEFGKYVQIVAGDQLTIARQRAILNVRLGHESGPHSWRHIVLMPGLFHAKIADCHGLLETHFGKPHVRSPGSLGFHNTVLDRLPITLTSLPPFRTCRDLIMVSLYARVLHCLLLVSGTDSLEACATSITSFDQLLKYATAIYDTYADADRVQELREQRVPEERARDAARKAAKKNDDSGSSPVSHIRKGDMVFENAVLFMRDALLTREFSDAIKAGDSGRVVIILRMFAFSYRGSGRSKYAHEMLHLLHNLTCVWTKELRAIVLQNWLCNPQGKANSFVEIDLVQEHLNFWIKKIYKADGDGHSWDWLALISPCVDILRQLATKINMDLGARQGSKHATPDLWEDIAVLMESLDEHDVYTLTEGRVLDDDEQPVPDIVSDGMAALIHGSAITPLAEFNAQFNVLRERRRVTPVSELMSLINTTGSPGAFIPVVGGDDMQTDSEPVVGASSDSALDDDDEPPELVDADNSDDAEDDNEDLFADSPTLTRFNEGDVDLDMDDDIPDWSLDSDDEDYANSDSDSDDE
ncbi:hypothetical protein C8J57DRAFT_1657987 [Mycena rebaudengoi]|nr:hypothetical protein C8J57DRAFT_1657987 [Mycena rebaudengoi]